MTLLKNLFRSLATVAFVAASSASAMATTIDFEGTGAPCCFGGTSPLTNYYSGLGVTFSGEGGSGGSILNQSGNFGFNALSGTDFLGFNLGVGTGNREVITFGNVVSNVSIWAANINQGTMSMRAYDRSGALLSANSITNSATWQKLSITATGNAAISKVVLEGSGNYYAYDDLQFNVTAVPEPETYALLLAGLGMMGAIARRRKAKLA